MLLFGLAKMQDSETEANEEQTASESKTQDNAEEPNLNLDEFGYDPRVLGMGSMADMFDQYGAIPNEFNMDQDKFLANR